MKAQTKFTTHTAIQYLLTVIGVAGIPAIILPFAWGYSPLTATYSHNLILSETWRIACPFFLPVLITIAIVRWIILKKHSKAEIIAGYMVGAAIICVTFSGYVVSYEWTTDDTQWQITFISPFVMLLFGIFFVLRNRKKLIPGPRGAIVLMQLAYLINCVFCLIGFFGMWQIAAYLSLATAIVYFAQIILLVQYDKPEKSLHIL
ncbi:MAG: hypothetical protein WAT20_08290 [Ferruginibacter sp.]